MKPLLSILTVAILAMPYAAASKVGQTAPDWKYLQGTDGKLHSAGDYRDADILVVVFLCNKCPCARGYDDRFSQFVDAYSSRGVGLVAINANKGPTETMTAMRQRSRDGGYKFHYLRDASQNVAKGFGALSTPHAFVLDAKRNIVYAGAFDDNRSASKVTRNYVLDAVNELLQGREVTVKEARNFGCAINYQ